MLAELEIQLEHITYGCLFSILSTVSFGNIVFTFNDVPNTELIYHQIRSAVLSLQLSINAIPEFYKKNHSRKAVLP